MNGQPAAAIQPHGFLLALSDDWLIEHASLNIADFLGHDARALIGSPAAALISVDAIHALRNRLALLRGPGTVERLFRCRLMGDDRHFDVAVHRSQETTIIEAEPSTGQSYGDITGTVRGMIASLDKADTLAELLELGTRQLRAMTGFDRVLIWRFGAEGGREVVAECARSGIAPMLGEQSPPEALGAEVDRRRAGLHVIPDTGLAPVLVVPDRSPSGAMLDLSVAVLRSDSPERLAALRAGDVGAAMTISLIVEGRAWGMVDCRHHFARAPGLERRSMAELFTQMFAMRIRIRELETALSYRGSTSAG